jgi:hypothetical protein
MILDWVSFLAYPDLFGIKDFVVVLSGFWKKYIVQGCSQDYARAPSNLGPHVHNK